MNGRVLTVPVLELEVKLATSGQLLTAGVERSALAGEVATTLVERVLRGVAFEGFRLLHEHVGVGDAKERSGHDGHAADGGHSAVVDHFVEFRRSKDWTRVVEC